MAAMVHIARCALDPDLCQIGLIGLWPENLDEPYALEQGAFDSEAAMLTALNALTDREPPARPLRRWRRAR